MRIVTMILFVLIAGCGYHSPTDSGSWVGGDARTLYVQLFDNQTAEPYLENFITDALIAELSRSRLVELTEDQGSADVQLLGVVKDFNSSAIAYGPTDQITDYRATMKVATRLVSSASSEVLWQINMQRSEDYLATVNKNLQLEGQSLAARQVSRRLAEDLHASLLNSF